jgi:putative tryptophan/tyrosine transport system substrate-binding protein
VWAQRGERKRIGVLMLGDESDPDQQSRVGAFRVELARMGWIEGQNIEIHPQFAATDSDRIRSKATDLVAQNPDAIVANGTPALQKRTSTIPIVFVGVSDPLSAGFVPSLARPGGNITGLNFSPYRSEIGPPWYTWMSWWVE